jgi:hypothetical protein
MNVRRHTSDWHPRILHGIIILFERPTSTQLVCSERFGHLVPVRSSFLSPEKFDDMTGCKGTLPAA